MHDRRTYNISMRPVGNTMNNDNLSLSLNSSIRRVLYYNIISLRMFALSIYRHRFRQLILH